MNRFSFVVDQREPPREGERAIRINGPTSNFEIATERLSVRMVSPIPDRLLDLLEIACAVFAADSTIPRGGATRPGMGEAWRRDFAFRIAVRDPAFWREPETLGALTAAADFLTDDRHAFDFFQSHAPAAAQDYVALDPPKDVIAYDHVILFSGGLDSLAGAIETLETTTGRVALVTHLSAQKRMPVQRDLADELQKRYPGRVLWVPVTARRERAKASETTQRSRSLLFAALGFVVARMLGATRLSFFENGVVSQNLPISPQVIGAMATRTTHPLGLVRLADLLGRVAGEAGPIDNPFQWLTKTEVVARLRDHGGENLVRRAVSCSHIWKRSIDQPHCGACSQCLDRRFALLGAGMAEADPAQRYETEVLAGPRPGDAGRTLALDWTRHALRLADITEAGFRERFGSELFRIIDGFPQEKGSVALKRAFDLHRRHGEAVRAAIGHAIAARLGASVARNLPPTALLSMLMRESMGRPGLAESAPPPVERFRPAKSAPIPSASAARPDLFPLQVALIASATGPGIEVIGLGAVHGAPAQVVTALKPTHDEDHEQGRLREAFRHTKAGLLAQTLAMNKSAVFKNVSRCRDKLAEYYIAIEDAPPPKPLLIENQPQKGYRLDPDCRFVKRGRD